MFNSLEFDIPVENGEIILFPSQCFHYVKSNPTDKDRISIAFNTFVKGDIGVETDGGNLKLN
jgi:ectoine hydroxylase-related dioxygenase (phytanoyl-CoA dioxygenase family)